MSVSPLIRRWEEDNGRLLLLHDDSNEDWGRPIAMAVALMINVRTIIMRRRVDDRVVCRAKYESERMITQKHRGVSRGVSISRRASRVCSSSIATPRARGSIGRGIKKTCLHAHFTFTYSRIQRRRRIVQSVSCQCH